MGAAFASGVRTRSEVVGASVAGPGHVRRGVTCQDRFAAEVLDDATVLLAVSDGLGVAAHAATGAEAAAGAAIRAGRALLSAAPETDPAEAVRQMSACARACVVSLAASMRTEEADLACTLIAVLARPDVVAVAHVGDGAVIVEQAGLFTLVSGPPVREYVNEVEPLTAGGARVASMLGPIDSVVALTDGCQHAAIALDGSVGTAFVPPIVDAVRSGGVAQEHLEALLAGPKISEHSDDDKTLVVVVL